MTGTEVSTIAHRGGVTSSPILTFSPDGSRIIRFDDQSNLGIYRVSDGAFIQARTGSYGSDLGRIGFTPAGDRMLVAGPDGIDVLSWPDVKRTAVLGGPAQNTWTFSLSPAGEEALALRYDDPALRLFRIADGAEVGLGDLAGVPPSVRVPVSFAPHDPTRILSGNHAARLYCRQPSDGWVIR